MQQPPPPPPPPHHSAGPFVQPSAARRLPVVFAVVGIVALTAFGLSSRGSHDASRANAPAPAAPAPTEHSEVSAPEPAASTPAAPDATPTTFRVVGTLPGGWAVQSGSTISNEDTYATVIVTPVDWQTPAQVLADDRERAATYGWTITPAHADRALGRAAQVTTTSRNGMDELRWYVPDGTGGTVLVGAYGAEEPELRAVVDALRLR